MEIRDGAATSARLVSKACSMRGWIVSDHNVAEALGHLDYAHSVINRKHAGSRDILARRSELQFWNGERS